MRPLTTLILLLIVASLGTFVYFWERHQGGTIERRAAGNLTALKRDDIEAIEIRNASGTAKIKKRPDGRWWLTSPFDDLVDSEFAERLISLAEKATIADTITHEDLKSEDLKAYGLDEKSAIQINWKKDGKVVTRLKLGKIGALGDTVYAEAPNNNEFPDVYLIWARPTSTISNLRDEVSKPIPEMRELRLVPLRPEKVTAFSIRRPGNAGEISVERKLLTGQEATPWSLVKPIKARGDQRHIDGLVGDFTAGKIGKLLPPASIPEGLPDVALLDVQFHADANTKPCTFRLFPPASADATMLTGMFVERKAYFLVEKELIDAIPTDPNELRALTLMDLDYSRLTTMLIENRGGESIPLYRTQGRWLMEKPDKTYMKVSGDRVAKTVQALNKAEIEKYITDSLTDPAPYGLDFPYQTITFGTPAHKGEIGRLTPENSLTLQFGKDKDGRLYANIRGESSVFLMKPEHIGIVPDQPLRWRDLQVLNFPPYSVKRLSQSLGAEPPLILTTLADGTGWAARRLDVDLSKRVAGEIVDRLLSRLGTLNVSDWTYSLVETSKRLENPSLQLEVEVEMIEDPNFPDTKSIKKVRLEFAPTGDLKTSLYFIGRCTDIPDYFLINRTIYQELASTLLTKQVSSTDS